MKSIISRNPWTAALAALGVVSMTSVLHADDNSTAASTNTPPAAAPSPAPLMMALAKAGLDEPFNKAGINIYGYVEGGTMYDATTQRMKDGPTYMGFNFYKNTVILDKISWNAERTVDPTKKQFDVGFRLEGIYGADVSLNNVTTVQQVEALKTNDSMVMVCSKCKTVWATRVKQGTKGAQLLTANGQTTDLIGTYQCAGCKSTLTVVGVQKGAHTELKHTCSMCGDNSAFCCATTPDEKPTKGMETDK